MHAVWGWLMAGIGLLMLVAATVKTRFFVCRRLVVRSKILWGEGDAVHRFYQVTGQIVMIPGVLWTTGLIRTR